MIDTIKIRLDGISPEDLWKNGMDWGDLKVDSKTGEIKSMQSNLGKIYLYANRIGLYITSSLPKLILNNNIEMLNPSQIKDAINIIEKKVGYNLDNGIITRIDLASTIEVEKEFKEYLFILESYSKSVRNVVYKNNSLQFGQTGRVLKFYDKAKEVRNTDIVLPLNCVNKNLLRYELMLPNKSSIKALFKSDLLTKDLFNPEIHKILVDEWYKHYSKIVKSKDIMFNPEIVKTPTNFSDYLMNEGIKSIGYDEIIRMIRFLPNATTKNKQRMRDTIRRILKKPYVKESELVNELNQKIEQVYQNVKQELTQTHNGNNNN